MTTGLPNKVLSDPGAKQPAEGRRRWEALHLVLLSLTGSLEARQVTLKEKKFKNQENV